jgi:hypothetical protein
MANISVVWDFLKLNNNLVGRANFAVSVKEVFDALTSGDATSDDAFNTYKSFIAGALNNGGAVYLSLEAFRDTVIGFENGTKRYFDLIKSVGQLV